MCAAASASSAATLAREGKENGSKSAMPAALAAAPGASAVAVSRAKANLMSSLKPIGGSLPRLSIITGATATASGFGGLAALGAAADMSPRVLPLAPTTQPLAAASSRPASVPPDIALSPSKAARSQSMGDIDFRATVNNSGRGDRIIGEASQQQPRWRTAAAPGPVVALEGCAHEHECKRW